MAELVEPDTPLGCAILLPLGRCCCPIQLCVAAFAAAGGGRVRSVVAIFPDELVRSFGFDLSVFSIPPDFFSGLGVLALGCPFDGGARFGEVLDCRLIVLGASVSELRLLTYDGRGGCAGRRSGVAVGRGISA